MKHTRTTEELDSLLGRGGMGAARRDAILESVLARVRAEAPARSRWRWSLAGFGVATAAAAALFLLVPRLSPPSSSPFRAKGTAARPPASKPSADIECLGATLDACPTGSLLVVRVAGVRGYVSAWAEPAGGGERIWYFSADTSSPLVDAVPTSPAIVTRAVKIGPEHAAGAYVVQVRVTERPMAREALLRLPGSAALAKGRARLTVTSP
jgi:hypothetical protein